MTFDQLNQGDNVYIIEVVGTFKKTTEYNVGTVISVSNAYDEPLQPGQFQLPNQPRKKLIDFNKELKLNDLTTIIVSRKDSILTAKIDIKNQQTIFVTENKEYKNTYKNWLVRFFHFDFKKIHIKNYQIVNSNPLIKVTDTRVIEIPDK